MGLLNRSMKTNMLLVKKKNSIGTNMSKIIIESFGIKFILVISVLLLALPILSYGYDNINTHPDLTHETITNPKSNSNLNNFLKKNLGFTNGLDEKIKDSSGMSNSVLQWVKKGSKEEDEPMCRASNHFHNPIAVSDNSGTSWENGKLTDEIWFIDLYCSRSEYTKKYSNLVWATGYINQETIIPDYTNDSGELISKIRNWVVAKNSYYYGLIHPYQWRREEYFAMSFESLGYILHLLQDVSVPAHVRNDFSGHLRFIGITKNNFFNPLKWFANPYEHFVSDLDVSLMVANEVVSYTGERSLTNYWDTDTYDPNNAPPSNHTTIGLAEYTNGNFLSFSTIFKSTSDTFHYFPYPNLSSTTTGRILKEKIAKDGKTDVVFYLDKTHDGEMINDFLSVRYVAEEMDQQALSSEHFYKLDKNVYESYAEKLIPRAVGYAASLIDYFFRGSLEITPPEQYVYAIIDGGVVDPIDSYVTDNGSVVDTQVFTKIKTKIKNVSPRETDSAGNISTYETIGAGNLTAVAKYKRRKDYLPDLSNDPPQIDSRESVYLYSVSAEVPIVSLDTATAQEYSFDFSQNPIPASITDLTLQIVFRGVLGDEQDGIAVGMVDLNEPDHHVFWNSTDHVVANNSLYTAAEIRNDPWLSNLADGQPIDPYDVSVRLYFSEEQPVDGQEPPYPPVADISNIPAGRYGRIIVLTGADPSQQMYLTKGIWRPWEATPDYDWLGFHAVNAQLVDNVWNPTPLSPSYTHRGVLQYHFLAEYYCLMSPCDYLGDLRPTPPDLTPYPVTILP